MNAGEDGVHPLKRVLKFLAQTLVSPLSPSETDYPDVVHFDLADLTLLFQGLAVETNTNRAVDTPIVTVLSE